MDKLCSIMAVDKFTGDCSLSDYLHFLNVHKHTCTGTCACM